MKAIHADITGLAFATGATLTHGQEPKCPPMSE